MLQVCIFTCRFATSFARAGVQSVQASRGHELPVLVLKNGDSLLRAVRTRCEACPRTLKDTRDAVPLTSLVTWLYVLRVVFVLQDTAKEVRTARVSTFYTIRSEMTRCMYFRFRPIIFLSLSLSRNVVFLW